MTAPTVRRFLVSLAPVDPMLIDLLTVADAAPNIYNNNSTAVILAQRTVSITIAYEV